MKARRLKALGFALLGSLALLLAGCPQQGNGEQNQPKPIQVSITGVTPGEVVAGNRFVSVSINEDSQVQEVALFVNDTLVARYNIAAQRIRPQALQYDFTVNTAACDPAFLTNPISTGCSVTRNTPLFPNGTYQIRAVVKNPVETKTISVPVVLDNRDRIGFTISGNSAQDANGRTWYGNGDVTVKGVIVNYTGATYTFQRVSATTWKINRTGGQAVDTGNFLPSGNQNISPLLTLSSVSGTDLVFAKSDNGITTPPTGADYFDSSTSNPLLGYILGTPPTLRIDNQAPAAPTLRVQRLYEETLTDPTLPFGDRVSRSTKLFYSGASDPGPGVGTDPASFQATLEFGIPTQTVTKGRGDSLNDLPTGSYSISVKKLVIKDRLGNTREVTTGLPSLNFNTTPASITFDPASPPAATATAGDPYTINLSPYTTANFHRVSLALKQGGNRYLLADFDLATSPTSLTWTAFKLGDGSSAVVNLAVVAFDLHGNVRELDLNVTVSARSAADQQAPVVNSLTASGALQADNALSSAILRARASERPSHSAGAVTFMSFFRQHSNAGQYFVPVDVDVATFAGGSSEDRVDSDPIYGSSYPNPGTFGTAVLVRDGARNAALGTGTLTVNP
jgi:hypothetical protein